MPKYGTIGTFISVIVNGKIVIQMDDTMINNMAKTLNVGADALKDKAQEVLTSQGEAWKNAGKSDDDCGVLALRVAARQINTANAALRRAGAENIEGMFVSCPRPKGGARYYTTRWLTN